MAKIDISKIDKVKILIALYNNAKCQGMGILHYTPEAMTEDEAVVCLSNAAPDYYFDYVKGRVMKISLQNDILDTWLYNRDNGDGAAERALAHLMEVI